jgi:hypothetical protein
MKGDMPQTEQKRYPLPGSDLGSTNAIPRTKTYDLETDVFQRSNEESSCCEQTYKVTKKGNVP